jgi:hypothetical protein
MRPRDLRNALTWLAAAGGLAIGTLVQAQGPGVGEVPIHGPGVRGKAAELVIRARVVEVDRARRSVVLRGPKGKLVTLDVPPEVKNFDRVEAGDDLTFHYAAAIAARIEPVAKRSGIRERIEAQRAGAAASGASPAVAGGRTVEILAVVEVVDRKDGTVILRGVKRTIKLQVPAGVDLSGLKVGDEVRAVFTEAAVLGIERAVVR